MKLIIRKSPQEVAKSAADILASHIRPGAVIGLATGSTPELTYQELIRRHLAGELSFSGTTAFLLDEYLGLAANHEQSYAATIRRELTAQVDIADSDVHSLDGLSTDPVATCAAYEQAIIAAGGVDIQLLGVGTNGHIGFNEPGSSLNSLTRAVLLHPQTVADNARFFDSEAAVPREVLTQGLGTIQRAKSILLIATGFAKAEAVAALAEGPLAAICPASVLQLHNDVTVIVDEDAASRLVHSDYYRFIAEHADTKQHR
ncbi:glucosamine-6-phosphate deaminase [Corynebacterium caspium]|uniref:glucosamine-6-phosphate deaminase n=1 Tax=Corynebacterium caspium TaxID=234828 RepID=UPI0003804502|nr:glucosamine-6-phosphate deaminase [Corynebacterium caspium]WKD58714.1 Glucosamine-6-phosphate deaminase [Corynebacterium caspium DSM 44850]